MGKLYWCPSVERNIGLSRRYFGFSVFAFGAGIYLGKRSWFIRLAVPR